MNTLPFNNVLDIARANNNYGNDNSQNMYNPMSSNNDFFLDIDPVYNTLPNGLEKQCKNYDTSRDFKNSIILDKNIALLHLNICSSANKIRDLEYMLENLKFNFSFIGLSEIWVTIINQDVLNITNYNHEQCIRNKNRKREDLSLTKNIYESTFIEIDKTIFKTSCNTIIGEIYRPPSSNLKTFNMEIDKMPNKI